MPLIEAIPDGSNMMKSHLITLSRGKSLLPFIQSNETNDTITLNKGGISRTISPTTANLTVAGSSGVETLGYKFTIVNFNYLESMTSDTNTGTPMELDSYGGIEAIAETVMGNTVTLKPTNELALFPAGTLSITTTFIIEGMSTGARKTLQLIVNA